MACTCTGVQKRVREFASNAVYIHCYAHVLNLVLVDSVKSVLTASEFFILLEALYVFVSTSKVHVIFKEKQLLIHLGKQPVELQHCPIFAGYAAMQLLMPSAVPMTSFCLPLKKLQSLLMLVRLLRPDVCYIRSKPFHSLYLC